MAKLERITGKVFGATASSSGDNPDIGQFGSAKAGTYNGTGNVAEIQALPAWDNGWIDAVTPTQQFPTLPEMTGVHKVLSYQNAYLLKEGMPEYDSGTIYDEGGMCKIDKIIYYCTSDNNTNNPQTLNGWIVYYDPDATQEINYLTPFCVNKSSVLDGDANCLSYSGATLTLAGNTTITNAQGTSYDIEVAKTLAMSTDGTYNIFASITDGSLTTYNNKIYRQPTQPTGENVATQANSISGGDYSGQGKTNAFDGSLTTFWGSSQVGSTAVDNTAWIGQQNLTQPVKQVKVYQSYVGAGAPQNDYCSSFKLQYSNDGSTWIDIQTVTGLTYQTWEEIDVQDYTPTGLTHSFRLLAITHPSNAGNWIIGELELLTLEDNTVWLDTSVRPLSAYKYNGSTWEEFTDVPVGTCTVASNTISAVKTFPYNVNGIENSLIKNYQNGASGYMLEWRYNSYNQKIMRYCIQYGTYSTGTGYKDITLPISYGTNTNYFISFTAYYSTGEGGYHPAPGSITGNSFRFDADYTYGGLWKTEGWIEE